MSDIAIRADKLGKRYRLGRRQRYRTLRDTIAGAFSKAGRAVRGARNSLGTGGPPTEGDEFIWAVKDVSFEVRHGDVIGVVGRNGAGKSTLLKILSRIVDPTVGAVDIYGRIGSLLEVGTGFHPELSGRENIYLNGAILGMRKREIASKFDEIVAFAEIEKFLDTPVKHYSSGMYVRLAFAVAAHLDPEILLVDEVLAVGDVAFQKKCLSKMGQVAETGRTVLFVSHNMAAVRRLCSQAILLDDGQIRMSGATDDVISQYLMLGGSQTDAVIPLPKSGGDALGEGVCIRLEAQDGTPRAQFRLGELWRIILEFEMHRAAPHVIAAIGLVSVDAVPITTYWSRAANLSPGRYSIEVECSLPLASCHLRLCVGLSSFERAFYYVSDVGHVSIAEVALTDQPFRASSTGLLIASHHPTIKVLEPLKA